MNARYVGMLTNMDWTAINLKKLTEIAHRRSSEGNKVRYRDVKWMPFYGGGTFARQSPTCNYRCAYCYTEESRDWPEAQGELLSPEEVASKMAEVSTNLTSKQIPGQQGIYQFIIADAEPTLHPEHLLGVLTNLRSFCKARGWKSLFILNTNGSVLGLDKNLAKELAGFDGWLLIRISFKAGTPQTFREITGVREEDFYAPFLATENLLSQGYETFCVSAMMNPRFTGIGNGLGIIGEQKALIKQLYVCGYLKKIEWEILGVTETPPGSGIFIPWGRIVQERLKSAGFNNERRGLYNLTEIEVSGEIFRNFWDN